MPPPEALFDLIVCPNKPKISAMFPRIRWEVLNGVGVDGVGVIFPFFTHCSLFSRIFPLFLRFSLLLLTDKGKQQQFTAKMGNFTPTPSALTSRIRVTN